MVPMRDVRGVFRDVTADAPTSVLDRGGQVVNPKAYGAKGDGNSDDFPVVQSLLDKLQSGDNLLFPPGQYKLSGTLLIGNGSGSTPGNTVSTQQAIGFLGSGDGIDAGNMSPGTAGTQFLWAGAVGGTVMRVNGPIAGLTMGRFGINGNAFTQCGNGIETYHTMHSRLYDIIVRRHSLSAFYFTTVSTTGGAVSDGANHNLYTKLTGSFGNGANFVGMTLGEDSVGAGIFDPAQLSFIQCRFYGGSAGASVLLRYTDHVEFVGGFLSNLSGGPSLKIRPPSGASGIGFPGGVMFYNTPCATTGGTNIQVDTTNNLWSSGVGVGFWPFPTSDGEVLDSTNDRFWGIYDSGQWIGRDVLFANRIVTASGSPSITAQAGAGGAGVSVSVAGNDQVGTVVVTTGAGPAAPDTVCRVTFSKAYGHVPIVIFTPGNRDAAALSGTTQVSASANTGYFDIITGTAALTGGTTYWWNYHVIGKNT